MSYVARIVHTDSFSNVFILMSCGHDHNSMIEARDCLKSIIENEFNNNLPNEYCGLVCASPFTCAKCGASIESDEHSDADVLCIDCYESL